MDEISRRPAVFGRGATISARAVACATMSGPTGGNTMTSFRERAGSLFACALGLAGLTMAAPDALAQARTDAIFAVTALDVSPGSADKGAAVLKQYRDAARKQPGNEGVDVLQEAGWPTRFVIFETWKDRASYDGNDKAAPLAELRDKLKPIADAPIDRRDYQVVTVGPAKAAAGAGAVFMQVHLDVFPPGLVRTIAALNEVAATARKGEGNLRYDVVQSIKAPTSHTTLYAGWQSREAFDAYQSSRYAHHFRDTVGPLLGSPFDDRLYVLVN
jgi:quinol monooxygenase YgiN